MSAEANRALVRRLVEEVVNERDDAVLDALASGDVAAAARGWVGPFRRAFPDFRMEIVHLVADDTHVAAHFKCSGTHEGEWRGVPATGRRFENVDEVYIFRVEGGKLASATAAVEDDLTRLRQLGIKP